MPSSTLRRRLLATPRIIKQLYVLATDIAMTLISTAVTLYLRLGEDYLWSWGLGVLYLSSVVIAVPIFTSLGLYRAIFRYSGLEVVYTLNKALAIYSIVFVLIFTFVGLPGVPRSIGLAQPMLFAFLVTSSRLFARYWLGGLRLKTRILDARAILIYGAGSAGRQLANSIEQSEELVAVGYVDDDERLHGHTLNGLQIYSPAVVAEVVNERQVKEIYLALPSIPRSRRNDIIDSLKPLPTKVLTLPGLMDLANGKVAVADLRELDVEDLLGREPVPPNPLLLSKNITGKTVMVTGAGGSIGSELCRQILNLHPTKLLLLEANVFALYQVEQELESKAKHLPECSTQVIALLANVHNEPRMAQIFKGYRPQTVYHAAAYKHVPLVERNPGEGVRNNVWGTLITAQQASAHGVRDFVLISTDKAVRPTNIMGATKRIAELSLQALARQAKEQGGKTTFSMVRFGNVLGSSGSVVPLFRKQIALGGPITLTDERVTRFFMTISEASQLVIQAGAMAAGGEVFLLDMGESVKIIDLAHKMVELSGLEVRDASNPDGDIGIEVTGLRPGEKLYEELLIGDNPQPTQHPRIMKANEEFLPLAELSSHLARLEVFQKINDVKGMRAVISELVPGYRSETDIVDWIYDAHEDPA